MHNRELKVQILSSLILKALTLLRPLSTFQVETMNKDSFRLLRKLPFDLTIITLNDLFLWSKLWFNKIKRPFLLSMLTSYFLKHSSQETLRIVEASQPEGLWPSLRDVTEPSMKLVVTIIQTLEPSTK